MHRHSSWSLAKLQIVVEFEIKAFSNSIGGIIGQLIVEPVAYIALLAAGLEGWNAFINTSGETRISYLTFAFPGILAIQLIRIFARAGDICPRGSTELSLSGHSFDRLGGIVPR